MGERSLPTRGSSFKNRLASMWNNARHSQWVKVKFPQNQPVYILGEMYHERQFDGASEDGSQQAWLSPASASDEEQPHVVQLLRDIKSRFYFSYRQGFSAMGGYTSDVGWGCMLRSGQMLLAEALVVHLLSRQWRLGKMTQPVVDYHREILRLFEDHLSPTSPFSIHQLLRYAASDGIKPGNWMGPTTVARALCRAVNKSSGILGQLRPLRAHFAADCILYRDEVAETVRATGVPWVPVFIVIPLRLGLKTLNDMYIPSIKEMFTNKECVGIMGGKPRHSLHFVGFQGDDLIGLDPHCCRDIVDMSSHDFSYDTFHCASPRKVPFSQLDPSLAVAFYCETEEALHKVYELGTTQRQGVPKLFSVADSFSASGDSSESQRSTVAASAPAAAAPAPAAAATTTATAEVTSPDVTSQPSGPWDMSSHQMAYWKAKEAAGGAGCPSCQVPRRNTEAEEQRFWQSRRCKGCGGLFSWGDHDSCPNAVVEGQRCWDWQLNVASAAGQAQVASNCLTLTCRQPASEAVECACVLADQQIRSGRHHWAVLIESLGVETEVLRPTETQVFKARSRQKIHHLAPGSCWIGVTRSLNVDVSKIPGFDAHSIGWSDDYVVRHNNSTEYAMLSDVVFQVGDVISLTLDLDSLQLFFHRNGKTLGAIFVQKSDCYVPMFGLRNRGAQLTVLPSQPEPVDVADFVASDTADTADTVGAETTFDGLAGDLATVNVAVATDPRSQQPVSLPVVSVDQAEN
eukprot:m.41060 g.41060  ORF g.41060 m.41060 type:complete len:743 (+) comp11425_c0_seq2:519-2747(+)